MRNTYKYLPRASHRSDHAAHSRQALSDGALLGLVFQQDARSAQEACRGGTGGGRARVRGNNTASVLQTAIDRARDAGKRSPINPRWRKRVEEVSRIQDAVCTSDHQGRSRCPHASTAPETGGVEAEMASGCTSAQSPSVIDRRDCSQVGQSPSALRKD